VRPYTLVIDVCDLYLTRLGYNVLRWFTKCLVVCKNNTTIISLFLAEEEIHIIMAVLSKLDFFSLRTFVCILVTKIFLVNMQVLLVNG